MANEIDFLEFLKANGIDPETLTGLQKLEEQPKEQTPTSGGNEKESGNGLDIESLLKQALGDTNGKGMDDDVPAVIEGQEPAALSAGEYVISASDVALLGDGNTEAGVRVIEQLLQSIREKKTGSSEQPPRLEDILK